MKKKDIKSLTREELEHEIVEKGYPVFRARQIYDWLHKKLVSSFEEMTNLSKELREELEKEYDLVSLKKVECLTSQDASTSKYLFELEDKAVIESVLMRYRHGNSVCISSQVGCRMGCRFCASTLGGRIRDLMPSEFLEQIYQIQKDIKERISHVVVMGTGEPFDNFDNLIRFLEIISDANGLSISQRNITVSTCGLTEKIRELAKKRLQITLAISLHAPDDETRRKIMPVANRYSISDILSACDSYLRETGRRVTFEYSLIKGVNDSPAHARELSQLLGQRAVHVNLIPVNPIKERDYQHSKEEEIQKFKKILENNRINVTIRREMGQDINAACGQLRRSYMQQKGVSQRWMHIL